MAVDSGGNKALMLTWEVRPDREEPWRRLLQELSDLQRQEEHVAACRRLGISKQSVWIVPMMGGGGTAVVYLEAEDPKRTLRELMACETLFDSWGIGGMGGFFRLGSWPNYVHASRVASGEILFSWCDSEPYER